MRLSAPIHELKRRARLAARAENIPLHQAQDRIARREGFAAWSLLAARAGGGGGGGEGPLLSRLVPGDMLLIGARPRQGKTRLGLRLLLDAAREGRRAVFFTLEYTAREAAALVRDLEGGDAAAGLEIATSDEIAAAFIIRRLAGAPPGSVAVIDYLQILDQRRSKPPLAEQMTRLRDFARERGVILGFLSQVDRGFDPQRAPAPGLSDIRLPNPVPDGIFSRACFLHGGEVRFQRLG